VFLQWLAKLGEHRHPVDVVSMATSFGPKAVRGGKAALGPGLRGSV
jgi:hypothetical protein